MWWPSRRSCGMPGEPKDPKRPGRRPEFRRFPEKLAIFMDAIAATMPYELACDQAGFSRSAFYQWKAWGEEGYQPYADFLEELRAREAEAVFLMHQDLKAAGVSGNINAIMFLLKARYPQHYSETVRQEHTGPNGGPVQVQTIPLPVFGPNDPLNHFDHAQEEPDTSGDDDPGK